MKGLTQEQLKESLAYDAETGLFTRLRRTDPNPRSAVKVGCLASNGYLMIRVRTQRYLAHRLAWLYVHGEFPEGHLDHVNGVKDDNRIANLRVATTSQNNANTGLWKHNTSGAKGVHFDAANSKWMAYIQIDGRFRNLGRFGSFDEAVAARLAAQNAVFGEFARPPQGTNLSKENYHR